MNSEENPPRLEEFAAFREAARRLGFMGIGFSPAATPPFFESFRAWVASGRHGRMGWLTRHLELRGDPRLLLEGCSTVVSLAYPYASDKPSTPDGFSTARYAEPDKVDYHTRLKEKARLLTGGFQRWFPKGKTRICVDSAPILERSFAYLGGMGFIGKNNLLILPGYGSYFFLVEILTTTPLEAPKVPPVADGCGACSRCLDACPTGALEGPYSLDASKCLSYLTIEYKGAVGPEAGRNMGTTFFGCDRCQEACPHNGHAGPLVSLPSSEEILRMGEAEFKGRFGKTALGRGGLSKIKENIGAIRAAQFLHR